MTENLYLNKTLPQPKISQISWVLIKEASKITSIPVPLIRKFIDRRDSAQLYISANSMVHYNLDAVQIIFGKKDPIPEMDLQPNQEAIEALRDWKPIRHIKSKWVQKRVKSIQWTTWNNNWKFPVPKSHSKKDLTIFQNGRQIKYFDIVTGKLVKRNLGEDGLSITPLEVDIAEVFGNAV